MPCHCQGPHSMAWLALLGHCAWESLSEFALLLLADDTKPQKQVPGAHTQQSYYRVWVVERWPPRSHGARTELWGHVMLTPSLSASFSCPMNPSLTSVCCYSSVYRWWKQKEQALTNAPQRASLQQRDGGLRCDGEVHGLSRKHLAMDRLAFLAT